MIRRTGAATDALSSLKLLGLRRELTALRLDSLRGGLDPGRMLLTQLRLNFTIIKALQETVEQDAAPPEQAALIKQELDALCQENALLYNKWQSYDPVTGKFDKQSGPAHFDIKMVKAM